MFIKLNKRFNRFSSHWCPKSFNFKPFQKENRHNKATAENKKKLKIVLRIDKKV
jgi:hypothetical protein